MTFPLEGIRVLDLTDGLGESCGRYLADLGAEVIRVEPSGGSASRRAAPLVYGVSIPFALRNANKLAVTIDLDDPSGAARLRAMAAEADIVIESFAPGRLDQRGLPPAEIVRDNPTLVWVAISGFGQTGPYRDWVATEQVLYALSGVLSRSGAPGAEPLLPPSGLIEETVGTHAAWSALLAYYKRLRTGRGELIDLSAFETVVHGFDPGFGTQGSAAAGRSEDFPRGRPDAANFYPVFACADGYVRICLLAKRQWRGIFEWLGEPAEFSHPKYDTIPARFAAADRLHPLIARLFADKTREELVSEGAARGVPVGGVHGMAEVLAAEHFSTSGSLIDMELAPGMLARVPSGYVSIDGQRAGIRHPAPLIGEHNQLLRFRDRPVIEAADQPAAVPPLQGLRVLDLGVIVFGAELSRQFADYGADVIKIENAAFPDGLRQSKRGAALSPSVAWGHRNKRSLGLDLRSEEGLRIFRELAADADIVLANFKPGTLASMGLSPTELAALNPGLIVSESSAFGNAGPWRTRLGYGPLVRASCGVSALWRYPDDAELLCDGMTVYPDHIAAQVAATAVLAVLIRREQTGSGGAIEVAQADTALTQLGTQLVVESVVPGSVRVPGNSDPYAAPSGVFPCAGDDEWCAVSVRNDQEWERLCTLIGQPQLATDPQLVARGTRIRNRDLADSVLVEWLRHRSAVTAMRELQQQGIAAGAMLRLPELLSDPHLNARGSFTALEHDLLPATLPAAAAVAHFSTIPHPPLDPAPIAGEHTLEICRTVLGMTEARITQLVEAGVLQPPAADPRESIPPDPVAAR
ncbi:CoA transferase [Nocardia sp. NPDC052112]|uniref:CaiB/BaiF CoA transferase family protein n=1 Tax=Nocardia sp. NPDC052112 TaxID=3155646 RepID=UPI00343C5C33